MSIQGSLFVIATPIGNLQDISLRALEVLKSIDLIAAEDTRHSKKLLEHFVINKPLQALHQHNEIKASLDIIQQLKDGRSVALISDAGTPCISDPGFKLVKLAHENNIKIVPLPGASAAIAALSVAGMPADQFYFGGFLPAKKSSREKYLNALQEFTVTLVFYETPHRIVDSLTDLITCFGRDREILLAREITKLHETIHAATLGDLLTFVTNDPNQQKGEFVLVVAGASKIENINISTDAKKILQTLMQELPLKTAAKLTAKISGESKNKLYEFALKQDK